MLYVLVEVRTPKENQCKLNTILKDSGTLPGGQNFPCTNKIFSSFTSALFYSVCNFVEQHSEMSDFSSCMTVMRFMPVILQMSMLDCTNVL